MVSVVIPVLEEERRLPALLARLRRQVPAVEIVVAVAPTGRDRSREVARAGGARVVTGGTPGQGRNAGARAATGELLLFLDADVLPGDDHFVARAAALLDARRLDLAAARYRSLGQGRRERLFYALYNRVQEVSARLGRPYFMGCCLLCRRAVHDAVGGFDESIAFASDYEYVDRVVRAGHAVDLLPGLEILADGRRVRSRGLLPTLWAGLRADLHRRLRGEIRDLAFVGRDYFAHPEGQP
jgi:GT2 family glycosyltransferase